VIVSEDPSQVLIKKTIPPTNHILTKSYPTLGGGKALFLPYLGQSLQRKSGGFTPLQRFSPTG